MLASAQDSGIKPCWLVSWPAVVQHSDVLASYTQQLEQLSDAGVFLEQAAFWLLQNVPDALCSR